MLTIGLGTKSQPKEYILQESLKDLGVREFTIARFDVPSGVPDQPMGLSTTVRGAINRATSVIEYASEKIDLAFGLEAGLIDVLHHGFYLVCTAALISKQNEYIGISELAHLPNEVSNGIKDGGSFGELIREYRENVHDSIEAEYLDDLVSRAPYFQEAIAAAYREYGFTSTKRETIR